MRETARIECVDIVKDPESGSKPLDLKGSRKIERLCLSFPFLCHGDIILAKIKKIKKAMP